MVAPIEISKYRTPVNYTVRITHHWDDTVEAFVEDVSDDERSKNAVISALERLLASMLDKRVGASGDDMLAVMLANIDHAMPATESSPAIFKVTPTELSSWADAVAKYEAARFPTKSE